VCAVNDGGFAAVCTHCFEGWGSWYFLSNILFKNIYLNMGFAWFKLYAFGGFTTIKNIFWVVYAKNFIFKTKNNKIMVTGLDNI